MNNKGFYVGCQVKILGTTSCFLKDSIGKIGTVVGINRVDEDCHVEIEDGYGSNGYNNWYYSWDELEVIK